MSIGCELLLPAGFEQGSGSLKGPLPFHIKLYHRLTRPWWLSSGYATINRVRPELTPDDDQALDLLPPGRDPYELAQDVAEIRIMQWRAYGLIRRVEELTDWEEAADHFDQLQREYQWSCRFFGLAWPPPLREARRRRLNDRT